MKYLIFLLSISSVLSCSTKQMAVQEMITAPAEKIKVLIIDGENNHGIWPKTTAMMKDFMEQTDLFTVEVNRTNYTWQGPHYDESIGLEDITELLAMYPLEDESKHTIAVEKPRKDPAFNPEFSQYDVIISNMGWQSSDWDDELKATFENYITEGGGLVVVHAANNAWGNWPAYNKLIGLGGWGGRTAETGPYVYYNNDGELIHDRGEGTCGSHGAQQEFVVTTRATDHPIMKGLPQEWMHAKDELYDRLRGPAESMTVLATAYSDPEGNGPPWDKSMSGTGRHEPILMAMEYGKGRSFHTAMGHMGYSMECVGFMTTFLRGVEWAASGQVTQKVPQDFPGADVVSIRPWNK